MGRLSEYDDAEVYLETAGRHEALGRRVEALLASEEPPPGLGVGTLSCKSAWAWFREQLLGNQCCCGHADCGGACCSECSSGSLATGGATGEDDGH